LAKAGARKKQREAFGDGVCRAEKKGSSTVENTVEHRMERIRGEVHPWGKKESDKKAPADEGQVRSRKVTYPGVHERRGKPPRKGGPQKYKVRGRGRGRFGGYTGEGRVGRWS